MTERQASPEVREETAPDQPTDLPRPAWGGVIKRTVKEFNADHLTEQRPAGRSGR